MNQSFPILDRQSQRRNVFTALSVGIIDAKTADRLLRAIEAEETTREAWARGITTSKDKKDRILTNQHHTRTPR
jgi:hypothetical protein